MHWLKFSLLTISAIAVIVLVRQVVLPLLRGNSSVLQVETPGVKAKVYLDDKEIGETPFLGKKLPLGEHKLVLESEIKNLSSKKVAFSKTIILVSATLTFVNYNFGPEEIFSSGDIRSKRTGEGILVITHPLKAKVYLNGHEVGTGPLHLSSSSGIHKILVSKEGYFSRELDIDVERGKRTVVEVFLAVNPLEKPKKIQEGKITLYDLSTEKVKLASSMEDWSKGVFFYEKVKSLEFDALIDFEGRVYYKDKNAFDKKAAEGKNLVIGYLGNKESTPLTIKAVETLSSITKASSQIIAKKVKIAPTPTGFLNVRSSPSTSSSVVDKVNPGETYDLLEEQSGWYKIKLPSGQGWVSSQYAKKI